MAPSVIARKKASPVIGAQAAPTSVLVVALVAHRQALGTPVRAVDGVAVRRIGGRVGLIVRPAGVAMVDVPLGSPLPATSTILVEPAGIAR